jgi:hypothetical protein
MAGRFDSVRMSVIVVKVNPSKEIAISFFMEVPYPNELGLVPNKVIREQRPALFIFYGNRKHWISPASFATTRALATVLYLPYSPRRHRHHEHHRVASQ